MKTLLIIALCALLGACASDITVRMPPGVVADAQTGPPLALVKVNDMRAPGIAASKREAAFGVPMGNITFNPPEAQLVKRMLESELGRRLRANGVTAPQDYVCEIVEFGVNTVTTPLYWDVVARVRLVLRQGAREYPLTGTGTERTYVWPGEELIVRVVDASLRQIAADLAAAAQVR